MDITQSKFLIFKNSFINSKKNSIHVKASMMKNISALDTERVNKSVLSILPHLLIANTAQ